jgi:hypothetical protein
LVVEGRLRLDDAAETIADLAYHLPRRNFATLAERNQASSVRLED